MAILPFSEATYKAELSSLKEIITRLEAQMNDEQAPGLSPYAKGDASAEHWLEVAGDLTMIAAKAAGMVEAIGLRFGGMEG